MLTTNPVIPVYTVDVVSRILEDWGPANICCRAYAAGPFCSSVSVCGCDVRNGPYEGVGASELVRRLQRGRDGSYVRGACVRAQCRSLGMLHGARVVLKRVGTVSCF